MDDQNFVSWNWLKYIDRIVKDVECDGYPDIQMLVQSRDIWTTASDLS